MSEPWEYLVVSTTATGMPLSGSATIPWHKRVEAGLNELGEEGWQLCAVLPNTLFFSRKKG
jgi:hypothetical protein